MTRLIDADALREDWLQNGENEYVYDANAFLESIDDAPTVEAIPKGVYEQVKWERDMAVQQLNDYGVQLGEKADCVRVVRCKDCYFKRINSFTKGCEIARCTLHEMGVALDDFCSYGVYEDGD